MTIAPCKTNDAWAILAFINGIKGPFAKVGFGKGKEKGIIVHVSNLFRILSILGLH